MTTHYYISQNINLRQVINGFSQVVGDTGNSTTVLPYQGGIVQWKENGLLNQICLIQVMETSLES